jgi:hypothetical protein
MKSTCPLRSECPLAKANQKNLFKCPKGKECPRFPQGKFRDMLRRMNNSLNDYNNLFENDAELMDGINQLKASISLVLSRLR